MAEAADPQARQKLLLGVMLVGGLGYLAYDYGYRPRAEEIAALEQRVEDLQFQNQAARQLAAVEGHEAVQRRVGLYREQLAQVEGLIPSSEELPDLLDAISAEAQRSGVELARIQPMDAQVERFYTRRRYELSVRGTYHQLGEFLSRVGTLSRIVTPTNLNLAVHGEDPQGGEPRLEANFEIETYVLPADTVGVENAE